jgi:hypothetical protein
VAETTRAYIDDLFAWLQATFPTPYPVELRWQRTISYGRTKVPARVREKGIFGDCYRIGRRIVIRLSLRRCRIATVAEETLLHEFAHAMTIRHDRVERRRETGHDDEWALAYGRVYREFARREGIEA